MIKFLDEREYCLKLLMVAYLCYCAELARGVKENKFMSYNEILWRDVPKLGRKKKKNTNWARLSITNHLIISLLFFILFYLLASVKILASIRT